MIETELGTDPAGSLTDVKTFLQTQHQTNGTHKSTHGPHVWIDAADYSTLTDAANAAIGKTLVISSSINLTLAEAAGGAVVIPATVLGVFPMAPGVINKNTATSLTINAPVVGNPMHQWLSGFAAGEVTGLSEYSAEWFSSFENAVTVISTTPCRLIVSTILSVTDNTTLPKTIILSFKGFGKLNIASGKTVTINGLTEGLIGFDVLIGSGSAVHTYNMFLGSDAGINFNPNQTVSSVPGYGNRNTGIGHSALQNNNIGVNNTAVGALAMFSNTGAFDGGNDNTAIGHKALYANSPTAGVDGGINNVAVGAEALMDNTTGRNNVAVGIDALANNIIGDYNTAIGYSALLNSTSTYNTAVGSAALDSQTTGERNTAIGVNALSSLVTGNYNTALGMGSLFNCNGSSGNTALGYQSSYNIGSGASNTTVGYSAGDTETVGNANVSGSQNVYIGYESGAGTATQLSNAIAIGYRAHTTKSNQVVIGNSSIIENVFSGSVLLTEMTAPSAPDPNKGLLFLDDNGAGKTRLMIQFNTGAAQQIAIQP